jgi:hypothetical protein
MAIDNGGYFISEISATIFWHKSVKYTDSLQTIAGLLPLVFCFIIKIMTRGTIITSKPSAIGFDNTLRKIFLNI